MRIATGSWGLPLCLSVCLCLSSGVACQGLTQSWICRDGADRHDSMESTGFWNVTKMHGCASSCDWERSPSLLSCVNKLNSFISQSDLCVISKMDSQMTPCINSPKRREGSVTGEEGEHRQGQTLSSILSARVRAHYFFSVFNKSEMAQVSSFDGGLKWWGGGGIIGGCFMFSVCTSPLPDI